MLKSQEPPTTSPQQDTSNASGVRLQSVQAPDMSVPSLSTGVDGDRWRYNSNPQPTLDMGFSTTTMGIEMGLDDNSFNTWEMIGLGIEEPLPLQEVVDELYVFLKLLLYMGLYPSGITSTSTVYTLLSQ